MPEAKDTAWQTTIWREWRNCEDEAYAEKLYELIAMAQPGKLIRYAFAVFEILRGLLLGLVMYSWVRIDGGGQILGSWPFLLAGGYLGILSGLYIIPRLSWLRLIGWITPGILFIQLGHLAKNIIGAVIFYAICVAVFPIQDRLLRFGLVSLVVVIVLLLYHRTSAYQKGPGTLQSPWTYAVFSVIGFLLLVDFIFANGHNNYIDTIGLIIPLAILFVVAVDLMNWYGSPVSAKQLYPHRLTLFWWKQRPRPAELTQALQQDGATHSVTVHLLQRAQTATERPPTELLAKLKSKAWNDRFMARIGLVHYGGQVVPHLLKIEAGSTRTQRLLADIATETTHRLADNPARWLCPTCLVSPGPHPFTLSDSRAYTYYGCRVCGQSRTFEPKPAEMVLVVDAQVGRIEAAGDRFHWQPGQPLIDFDRVHIVEAGDELVERLAMQLGNDTDPVRQPRYRHMVCSLEPSCRLSENSRRILKRTFGVVQVVDDSG